MASGYSDLSEISKSRAYGIAPKPPKIDLINERPRRESLIERQLTTSIVRPELDFEQQFNYINNSNRNNLQQQVYEQFNQVAPRGTGEIRPQIVTTQRREVRVENTFIDSPPPYLKPSSSSETATSSRRYTNNEASVSPSYDELVNNLAEEEDKLKKEVAYMNRHLSPWARPRQVREPRKEPQARSPRGEQRWMKECPSGSNSRPTSRASSTRSNVEADLMEKASKLLQDVEELEKKPFNSQQVLIESGASSRSGSEKPKSPLDDMSSIHTAIIKVPKREIDNKSPLPFSYDNFSTLGVRGNIASVGAAEPEKPYAPIFPVIRRNMSQTSKR